MFFNKDLEYLRHIVSQEGVKPLPINLLAIEKMKAPSNIIKLHSFLGLVRFYQRFIPAFADLAQALFKLLKKDASFKWTDSCERSFKYLKTSLMTTPLLKYSNHSTPFILFTKASLFSVGVVLSQNNDDVFDQPIAYFSRTLNKHERNYTVTEKECLAVLFGIQESQP